MSCRPGNAVNEMTWRWAHTSRIVNGVDTDGYAFATESGLVLTVDVGGHWGTVGGGASVHVHLPGPR